MIQNFQKALSLSLAMLSVAEIIQEECEVAQTEDDLFAIKTRCDNLKRMIDKLTDINNASFEGRVFED